MHTRTLQAALVFLGIVATVQGCVQNSPAGALHQNPGTQNHRRVAMGANCEVKPAATGARFELNQVSFTVRHRDTITWYAHPSSNAAMEIIPKPGPARWGLLMMRPDTIPPGGSLPIVIPPGADTGRYKYSVRFICNRTTAQPDTVLVDPDFILVM